MWSDVPDGVVYVEYYIGGEADDVARYGPGYIR